MQQTNQILIFLALVGLSAVTIYLLIQQNQQHAWTRETHAAMTFGTRFSLEDAKEFAEANNLVMPEFGPRPATPTPFWSTSERFATAHDHLVHADPSNPHQVPMNFFHCVGFAAASRIIFGHAVINILYFCISLFRFVPAALAAKTRAAALAWWAIAFIFPFCALSGYATTILAGWVPSVAYFLKEWMCYADIVVCVAFLVFTSKTQLVILGDSELREEIRNIIQNKKPLEVIAELKEII